MKIRLVIYLCTLLAVLSIMPDTDANETIVGSSNYLYIDTLLPSLLNKAENLHPTVIKKIEPEISYYDRRIELDIFANGFTDGFIAARNLGLSAYFTGDQTAGYEEYKQRLIAGQISALAGIQSQAQIPHLRNVYEDGFSKGAKHAMSVVPVWIKSSASMSASEQTEALQRGLLISAYEKSRQLGLSANDAQEVADNMRIVDTK